MDKPKLRPHPGWRLKARRPFTRKGRHGSTKLDHNDPWRDSATRRTPALVGSGGKGLSLFSLARRGAPDLALHRLVERRSEQLKVHRPATRRLRVSEPIDNVLAQLHQIARDHAIFPSGLPRLGRCI